MSTQENVLIDYLAAEADRVVVYDTLPEIEEGIQPVALRRSEPAGRSTAPLLAAAAVSVLLVAGMLALSERRPAATLPAAAVSEPPINSTTEPEPTTTTPSTEPTLAVIPLPGGATMQGFTPICTTVDGIEYDCEVADYPAVEGIDRTGETQVIVDDTSHVSGGCRSTASDGTSWECYIGQRAIDEQIVGPNFLGEWAPRGWIAG